MGLQPITDAVNRVLRDVAPRGTVPYDKLKRAEAVARERFPEANRVHALWTPASSAGEVVVEVWTGDTAREERATTFIPSALELVPA
jgi:hypothetical protein